MGCKVPHIWKLNAPVIKVGALAIQGAFAEHVKSLNNAVKELNNSRPEKPIHANIREIRYLNEINNDLDGLIIPGGESTVMQRYLNDNGYTEKLRAWTRIQTKIGGLDITTTRNAFGRQIDSFESNLVVTDSELLKVACGNHCPGVFIRAPQIKSIDSKDVAVLCRISNLDHDQKIGDAVGVRQKNVMASTFHPELTSDLSWHKYFILQVVEHKFG